MSGAPEDASRLILVGRVAGAFGVRGELRITTYTADPLALAQYRDLKREDGSPGLTLTSARVVKGGVIARAAEVADRDQAEAPRGLSLFVPREILPEAEEDEFYLADLIGLEARDASGAVIGKIKSIQDFGAGDLLEIEPAGGGTTWWLPFTKDAVPEVSIAGGFVVVVKPEETE
jgi:16S rRNA processing protein RimM